MLLIDKTGTLTLARPLITDYPVVGLADGGRTLRLDLELLRQQFNLDPE